MKPRCSNQRNPALTLVEVLVIIVVLGVLAAVILFVFVLDKPPRNYSRINCVNNLHQIDLAFKRWGGDRNDKYPMQVSMTNGGAMELVATGNVAAVFLVMSNELNNPKVLICPADTNRVAATNFWSRFDNKNVSYFIGVDAADDYPQRILSGDDNLSVGGNQARSGLVELLTNTPVAWTAARHRFAGNILLADCSVQQTTSTNLNLWFQQTGLATNRLAIP